MTQTSFLRRPALLGLAAAAALFAGCTMDGSRTSSGMGNSGYGSGGYGSPAPSRATQSDTSTPSGSSAGNADSRTMRSGAGASTPIGTETGPSRKNDGSSGDPGSSTR